MTEKKSTFARRVRAARPRAKKYEVRDDVVSGLALTIQPTGVQTYFLSRMVHGRGLRSTTGASGDDARLGPSGSAGPSLTKFLRK